MIQRSERTFASTYVPFFAFFLVVFALIVLLVALIIDAQGEREARLEDLAIELHRTQDQNSALRSRLAGLELRVLSLEKALAPVMEASEVISRVNPSLRGQDLVEVASEVVGASRRHGVPADLILALGAAESDWRLAARGGAGEVGPLQVLPSTLAWLGGGDPADWRITLDAGVKMLRYCLDRSGGREDLAVACYNAGPNRPPAQALRISRQHVEKVLGGVTR